MALYKYMQLAVDIKKLLRKREIMLFDVLDIRNAINTKKGFYSYSNTTLENALNFLTEFGSIKQAKNNWGHTRHFVFIEIQEKNNRLNPRFATFDFIDNEMEDADKRPKYKKLAEYINDVARSEKWLTFKLSDLRPKISEHNVFQRYAASTIERALQWLEETDVIEILPDMVGFPRLYAYTEEADRVRESLEMGTGCDISGFED